MAEKTDWRFIFNILLSHGEEAVQFLIYEGFWNDIGQLLLLGLPMKMMFLLPPPLPHVSPFTFLRWSGEGGGRATVLVTGPPP